jgi:hypothetical protein
MKKILKNLSYSIFLFYFTKWPTFYSSVWCNFLLLTFNYFKRSKLKLCHISNWSIRYSCRCSLFIFRFCLFSLWFDILNFFWRFFLFFLINFNNLQLFIRIMYISIFSHSYMCYMCRSLFLSTKFFFFFFFTFYRFNFFRKWTFFNLKWIKNTLIWLLS